MKTKVLAIIPARLGSQRFPRKALYQHLGKPLLFYLYQAMAKAKLIDRLVIGTDSKEIKNSLETYGAEVIMTKSSHKTGSDRAAEIAGKIKSDIVINIQGDNFSLNGSVIDRVIKNMFEDRSVKIATLAYKIDSDNDLFDPNLVKLIKDKNDNALWFSRYPIPYLQNVTKQDRCRQFQFWGHMGVYFFRRNELFKFTSSKQSDLEKAESLEQLRILENSGKIKVYPTRVRSISVDTIDDIAKIKNKYK